MLGTDHHVGVDFIVKNKSSAEASPYPTAGSILGIQCHPVLRVQHLYTALVAHKTETYSSCFGPSLTAERILKFVLLMPHLAVLVPFFMPLYIL